MYRTLQANGLAQALQPRPAFRLAPRALTKRFAFAAVHTQHKAQPARRKGQTAALLSSSFRTVLSHTFHRPSYRSYASSSTPSESSPDIIYATIGLCCAIFFYNGHATAELAERGNPAPADFMKQNMICSMENWREGRWWTLLLSSFNHYNVIHLGANMLMLYRLGPMFVSTFGVGGYILTWVVGAVSSCGLSLWWENQGREIPFVAAVLQRQKGSLQPPEEVVYGGVLGPSGSILGLSTGLMRAMPNISVLILGLPYSVRFWVFNSLVAVLSGCFLITDTFPYLGHAGHLGGMAAGLVCGSILLRL